MTFSPGLAIGLFLGSVLLIAGLFRPFLGMLVFLVIHFVQPAELFPALALLRIELVYGVLLAGILFYRRITIPGPRLLSDKILLSTLLLIGAGLLSIPFSVWPGGAADTVINMVKLITLVFLLTLMVDSTARLRMTLWCLATMAAWFAGSSLIAYSQGQYYALGNLGRAKGINSLAGDPNELAGLLLAMLPLLVALLRSTRNIFGRIFALACVALSVVAISLTGARIVAISLIALAVFYIVQSKRKFSTFLACLLIACMLWHWLPQEYKLRYLTVEHYAQGGELDASNQLRLEIWRGGRQIFLKYPIFGVGAGQFGTAYGLIILVGRHGAWMQPHNLLIQVACELGIVGLIAFGNLLWQIAKGIAAIIRKKKIRGIVLNYEVAIACSAMLFGVIILSTVSHTLYRPYWYILAGLVAANRNILRATLERRAKSRAATDEVARASRDEEQNVSPAAIPT
jgi:O-antigen ligase